MSYILFINTIDREHSEIALVSAGKVLRRTFKNARRLSEQLPKELSKLMKGVSLKGIAVVKGPGAFMGTRTGVTYANALAFALGVPVLGLTTEEVPSNLEDLTGKRFSNKVVSPRYSGPPNITAPRKKNLHR